MNVEQYIIERPVNWMF